MNNTRIRILALAAGDIFTLFFTLSVVFGLGELAGGPVAADSITSCWEIIPCFLTCAALVRLYNGNVFYPGAPLPPVEEIRRMTFAVTFSWILTLTLHSVSGKHEVLNPVMSILAWLFACIAVIPVRSVVRALLRRWDIGQTPVLIAGGGKGGRLLVDILSGSSYFGYRVAGILDDSEKVEDRIGSLDQAAEKGRELGIETLIAALPPEVVLRRLKDFSRQFKYIQIMLPGIPFPISWAYPVNILSSGGIELQNQLLLPGPHLLKTAFELFLSAFCILTLCPVFLILALLVKLSSAGPVFYKAQRIGQSGRKIEVWKFRTMYENADVQLDSLLNSDSDLANEWQRKFKLDNDPRVTKIGAYLRKTSLDELPQLFNVLRGEMSIIGPRPIVKKEIPYYGDNYEVFCRIKPGITGLWQISGRSDTTYEERVKLDMYYIFNWSIWQDLYILARTLDTVIRRKGAR